MYKFYCNSIKEANENYADYCGISGIKYIFHNNWADSELWDIESNRVINTHDVEDWLWSRFEDEGGNINNHSAFVEFIRANEEDIKNWIRYDCTDYKTIEMIKL